ncbi:MAG: type I glyceraldehyde-3-phosphate dehydrogenase [Desulfohalobiaceae bacterium]
MGGIRLGINGFGRIGRQVLRAVWGRYAETMEVAAINDLFDVQTNANLLQHDTNYGRFAPEVKAEGDDLVLDSWRVANFSERDPSKIPWGEMGVDVVIEATGIFNTGPLAGAHLDAGAHKVIITAPAKEPDLTLVLGVNDSDYDPQRHHVVSNASCTTNCLAPLVSVLHREFRIKSGSMSTVHAYTNDQRILDQAHKDPRRSRAAACNIIPTTTGAAKAVGLVIPELEGCIDGYALRVPTPTVSVVDFAAILEREATADAINKSLREAANSELQGILGINDDPLVSSDFIGDPRSAILDPEFTGVRQGNLAKVMAWYDNEWGYSCRVADLAARMGQFR